MAKGKKYKVEDGRYSTFEPSTTEKDIFRPDALMLPESTQ